MKADDFDHDEEEVRRVHKSLKVFHQLSIKRYQKHTSKEPALRDSTPTSPAKRKADKDGEDGGAKRSRRPRLVSVECDDDEDDFEVPEPSEDDDKRGTAVAKIRSSTKGRAEAKSEPKKNRKIRKQSFVFEEHITRDSAQ